MTPPNREQGQAPAFVVDHLGQAPAPAVDERGRPPLQQRPGRPVQVVEVRPLPRADVPRPRSAREDRTDWATGFSRLWVAFWTNLWTVGRWCLLAAVVAWLGVGAWLGQPWGWVAGAVPLVVLVAWLTAVVSQGRRHMRGQAGPPPGWTGRGL